MLPRRRRGRRNGGSTELCGRFARKGESPDRRAARSLGNCLYCHRSIACARGLVDYAEERREEEEEEEEVAIIQLADLQCAPNEHSKVHNSINRPPIAEFMFISLLLLDFFDWFEL